MLRCALLFVLVAVTLAQRPPAPPPPPPPAPQPLSYICFTLETWCNQFNLTLDKYDTLGNGYYYGTAPVVGWDLMPVEGVDTSCYNDDPEDVMYGVYYAATSTYSVKYAKFTSYKPHTLSFYWNMTNSLIGQSTVIWRQDRSGLWKDALTWANRVDIMEEALDGPDFYLTPRPVAISKC